MIMLKKTLARKKRTRVNQSTPAETSTTTQSKVYQANHHLRHHPLAHLHLQRTRQKKQINLQNLQKNKIYLNSVQININVNNVYGQFFFQIDTFIL
jgi:hypothetical protein